MKFFIEFIFGWIYKLYEFILFFKNYEWNENKGKKFEFKYKYFFYLYIFDIVRLFE